MIHIPPQAEIARLCRRFGSSAAAYDLSFLLPWQVCLELFDRQARGASMKVVAKATDMADEAHRLDLTVKTFLREVTA